MNLKVISAAAVAAVFVLIPVAGQANTIIAQDTASSLVYAGGSYKGQNGGTGFNPYSVVSSGNAAYTGSFVYTASESEGNNGTPTPGSIDTPNSVAGGTPLSFGMFAQNADSSVTVSRTFTTSMFQPGQMFSLDFVKGYNDAGTSGVALTTVTGTQGDFNLSNRRLSFNGTDTGLGFHTGADHLLYTVTGFTTYSLQSTGADNFSGTGTFTGAITGFQVKQTNSGATSPDHNAYFNNLSLTSAPAVPEASSSIGLGLMLALGGLVLVAKKRSAKA